MEWGWTLTTTITIVLCPSEKNRPQVTGSCPMLMRVRVALSIALPGGRSQATDALAATFQGETCTGSRDDFE